MALTKLTKHVVHGATIVQVRYKDQGSEYSWNNTDVNDVSGMSITLTPQYADSILECFVTFVVRGAQDGDSPDFNAYLDINGTDEYTLINVLQPGSYTYSFNQQGRVYGASVTMYHRHLPGTTNLQTIKLQINKNNNNGGNGYVRNGFMLIKEIASGVTSGTPGNTYVP